MYCCVLRSHYRTSRTECRYREIEENEHTKWGYSICVNRLVLETSAHTHRVKRPKITIHVPPPKQNEENNPESTTQREIRNDVTEWIGRWTSRKRFVTRVSAASFSLLFSFCFLLFFSSAAISELVYHFFDQLLFSIWPMSDCLFGQWDRQSTIHAGCFVISGGRAHCVLSIID